MSFHDKIYAPDLPNDLGYGSGDEILNLELKYLDANVRPRMDKVLEAWGIFKRTGNGVEVIIELELLLFSLLAVDRLEQAQSEGYLNTIAQLRSCIEDNGQISDMVNFTEGCVDTIKKLYLLVGAKKLFARPMESTELKGGKLF